MVHLNYLEGRLRRNGVDPAALGMRGWLQVGYAEMIDQHDGLVNRREVIEAYDERLARPVREVIEEAAMKAGLIRPDPKRWGTSPQAVANHRAMMRMAGGPAAGWKPQPREESPA